MNADERRECDCCRYFAKSVREFKYKKRPVSAESERSMWLCPLCANTMASSWNVSYPEQHDPNAAKVMATMCFIGNAILDTLGTSTLMEVLAEQQRKEWEE